MVGMRAVDSGQVGGWDKGMTDDQAEMGAMVFIKQKQDYYTKQRSIDLFCIHPEKDFMRDSVILH